MIIKIIPETDVEKTQMENNEIEYTGVKEYMFFGNREEEGGSVDFHDWKGSYKTLIGSLKYYEIVIQNEYVAKNQSQVKAPPSPVQASGGKGNFIKYGPSGSAVNVITAEDLQKELDKSKNEPTPPWVKNDIQDAPEETDEVTEAEAEAVEAEVVEAEEEPNKE